MEWSLDALCDDGAPGPVGRLTRRAEFKRVAHGRRVPAETFTLQSRPREEADSGAVPGARVGFTVTKAVGGAVERNRVRRRLKEALSAARPLEAEGDHDYVLMARREALGRCFSALVDDVRNAFRAARRRSADARRRDFAAKTPKGKDRPR